ncbi:MAG: hypothetical protein WKF37_14090 [Bryobacteraceae bacterium]
MNQLHRSELRTLPQIVTDYTRDNQPISQSPRVPVKSRALNLVDLYFAFWAPTIPITSFLLLPIQGTTPAYVFALSSTVICLFAGLLARPDGAKAVSYFFTSTLLLSIAVILTAFGQFGLTLHHPDITQLNLISPEQTRILFRSTIFTQMLYFAACVLTFCYVRYFFKPSWMRWVLAGAWLLVLYGFYDWFFYAIFHRNGDFLANRTFGVSEHTGSWLQTIQIGGVRLARLKSFTGEPSMFALVGLPYFLVALHEGKKVLSGALLAALILSTSTSAYLGLIMSTVFIMVVTRRSGAGRRLQSWERLFSSARCYFSFFLTCLSRFLSRNCRVKINPAECELGP